MKKLRITAKTNDARIAIQRIMTLDTCASSQLSVGEMRRLREIGRERQKR